MSRIPTIAPETILVVDDTAIVLESVSFILKNAGFTVLSASSPEEAIQISLNFAEPIHLLLTDVVMPKMSGPDLAKTLVAQRTKLRVMMMTGYANVELPARDCDWHVMTKPFAPAALREQVNAILHSPDCIQDFDR
jgi:two-component system, cell cycle sensor histidine kinase and response regulator CckA